MSEAQPDGSRPMAMHGVVLAIAVRPSDGRPMTEVGECSVVAASGIHGENRGFTKRGVTLLSRESWSDVCRQLGVELPWYARRANILVGGLDLAATLGKTLIVGSTRLQIQGETKPCGIMDQQHPGLKGALVPSFRGGVFGQVLCDGAIRVGDQVRLADGG